MRRWGVIILIGVSLGLNVGLYRTVTADWILAAKLEILAKDALAGWQGCQDGLDSCEEDKARCLAMKKATGDIADAAIGELRHCLVQLEDRTSGSCL